MRFTHTRIDPRADRQGLVAGSSGNGDGSSARFPHLAIHFRLVDNASADDLDAGEDLVRIQRGPKALDVAHDQLGRCGGCCKPNCTLV